MRRNNQGYYGDLNSKTLQLEGRLSYTFKLNKKIQKLVSYLLKALLIELQIIFIDKFFSCLPPGQWQL